VLAGSNGAFTFSKLPAGKYVLCAQVPASEPAPANSPYVDTCVWGSGQAPITLAAGQQVAGVVFTAPKGTWLQVRVADPDHVLPQVAAKGPALLEPQLQLVLQGPDSLNRHARFLSSDSGGRNYQLAIPLKTALNLKIASSVANVFDQAGNQVYTGSPLPAAGVTDFFAHCSQVCRQGGSESVIATQTIYANNFPIATKAVMWTCAGVTIQD
jgi:hypothetical protein